MNAARYVALVTLLAVVLAPSTNQRLGRAFQAAPDMSEPTRKAVASANAFLTTLNDTQRARVRVELNARTRSRWSNLPPGSFFGGGPARNGIRLGELTDLQQQAALALVATTLSSAGYQKAIDIMNAEGVLRGRARRSTASGREDYLIAILGVPSTTTPWMIQLGGHHLGLNITIVGAHQVLTPTHTGVQPSWYTLDGHMIRPLGNESDKALALVNALDTAQRRQAVLTYRVADAVLGPGHDGETIQPEGVRASTFTAAQQTMLLDLVHEWAGILNDDAAAAKMADVRARLADTYFAWSGATAPGSASYFRIQGPTLVIEYAPQGGLGQRGADHVHTFFRDPTNDYGAKYVSAQGLAQ